MTMLPTIQHDKLKKMLMCAVCKDVLDNPKLLPCHHSFCLECVEGLVQVNNLSCPECRKTWVVPPGGPSALQADFRMNTLKEILAEEDNIRPTTCEQHPEKQLELFCKMDSRAICLSCIQQHDGHSFVELDTVIKEFEDEWNKIKEEQLKSITETINKVDEDKHYFENENKCLMEELELDRKRAIEAINNQFSSLKQNIDAYHKREYDARIAIEEDMQTNKAIIETFTTYLGTIQDNVEKVRVFIGLKEQGLYVPEHSPADPFQYKPCEIMTNKIMFGSLYRQRGFDENITFIMSMLDHPMSMIRHGNLPTEASEPTPMSIQSELEAMSISSGSSMIQHQPEIPLPIQAPRYLSKPIVRKKTNLPTISSKKWIRDVAEVDASTQVAVRTDEVQFYNNSELTNTIHGSMWQSAITPDKCIALTNLTGVISIYNNEGIHKRDIKTPFTSLVGIACNDNGELVVSDMKTGTVGHIDYNTGEVVTTTPKRLFPAPWNIAVNLNNDVVLAPAEPFKHCITVIDRDGNKKMEYGTEGSDDGQLNGPIRVCSDGNNIIVADTLNTRISLICSTGHLIKHLLTVEDGLMGPTCVAIGHQGHLLVGDFRENLFEVEFKE